MKPDCPEFFLFLASHAPWGKSPSVPADLFQVLGHALRPDRFDENDPARRPFTGTQEDIDFWLMKTDPESLGRYLYLKKAGKQSYYLAVDWVDPAHEWVRSRGDYSNLYGRVKGTPAEVVVQVWQEFCRILKPFHAFLDTEDQYNRRAHKILRDGSISKTTGWYKERLPGFFAYNYFGNVYLRHWGERVNKLPHAYKESDVNGLFISAPSGLDLESNMPAVFSPADLEIIETLGSEWFHLPGQTDQIRAPTLEEFIAATPQRE